MARRRKARRTVANPRRRRPAVRRRRRVAVAANPRRRRVTRRRRRVAVAANPRRRRVSRRNPRRRVMRRRSRRNPVSLFGVGGGRNIGTMIGGGLIGVAAAKIIPRTLASTLSGVTGSMGQYGGLIMTGAAAWAAGWLATKFVNPTFGSAVLFGGLMQTGSVALNLFLPSFTVGGVPLALSGMGELVPGQFVVPQNPLRLPAAPAPAARVNMNGLSRAYGNAF